MKKRLMTALACGVFALIGGFALTACCDTTKVVVEEITKADFATYIEETAKMYFNKGFKINTSNDNMTASAEIVKNGNGIDAKILMEMDDENHAMYIKNGEGFEKTERGLEKMTDISEPVAQYSIPFSDCSTFMNPFLAPETTGVTKTIKGNEITFTFVDKVATIYEMDGKTPIEPCEKYDTNMTIVFVDDSLVKFEAESADVSKFVYSVLYEEFAGPVDFAGVDLDDYIKEFTLGKVNVTLTNKFVQQENIEGSDYHFKHNTLEFIISHEDASSYPSMTTQQYAAAWQTSIKVNPKVISSEVVNDTDNDLVYVKYHSYAGSRITIYSAFIFKGSDNIFYVCQFGDFQNEYNALESQIIQWAKTITVS